MKTKEAKTTAKSVQNIQLVEGEFNPSEAAHIITSLLDEKINFHKLQRLQIWEGDQNCETKVLNNRIVELENEKEIAKKFINSIRGLGKNLKINGTLEISLVE